MLVACPTARVKDYGLMEWWDAYQAFTYPSSVFMVDNTPGTLEYARRIRALGIPCDHLEPLDDLYDTMELCWQRIATFAHENSYDAVASIESDVICPPNTLEVLLEHWMPGSVVAHKVNGGWCLGCTLIDTEKLYEARYEWKVVMEAAVRMLGGEYVMIDDELDIKHLEREVVHG